MRNTRKHWTIKGTIVRATQVQRISTKKGKNNHSAILYVQQDANDPGSPQVAVKVTGDLCNWVGCIGARVMVEFVIRVFDFDKNGITMMGNDVYANSIRILA